MLSQSCQVISNTIKCSWSGHIKTFWTPFIVVLFHMDHLKRMLISGSDAIQRMNQSRLQHPALRFWMALKLTDTSVWVWTMKQCQRQIYIRERQIGIKREREQEKGENLQRQYLTWPDGRCMQTNHICSYLVCLRATMLMSVCVSGKVCSPVRSSVCDWHDMTNLNQDKYSIWHHWWTRGYWIWMNVWISQ